MTKRTLVGQLLGNVVSVASLDVAAHDKAETPIAARAAASPRTSHGFAAVQRKEVKRVQSFASRRRGK